MWFVDISVREDMKYRHESRKTPNHSFKGLKGFSSVHTGFYVDVFCELLCTCKSVNQYCPVCSSWPWTACTAFPRSRRDCEITSVTCPPDKDTVLLPSSAEAHVSDEAHRIIHTVTTSADFNDSYKPLMSCGLFEQTVITRSACPCQTVRW